MSSNGGLHSLKEFLAKSLDRLYCEYKKKLTSFTPIDYSFDNYSGVWKSLNFSLFHYCQKEKYARKVILLYVFSSTLDYLSVPIIDEKLFHWIIYTLYSLFTTQICSPKAFIELNLIQWKKLCFHYEELKKKPEGENDFIDLLYIYRKMISNNFFVYGFKSSDADDFAFFTVRQTKLKHSPDTYKILKDPDLLEDIVSGSDLTKLGESLTKYHHAKEAALTKKQLEDHSYIDLQYVFNIREFQNSFYKKFGSHINSLRDYLNNNQEVTEATGSLPRASDDSPPTALLTKSHGTDGDMPDFDVSPLENDSEGDLEHLGLSSDCETIE